MTEFYEKKKITIQEKLNMSLDEIIIIEQTNQIIDLKNNIQNQKKQKKNIKRKLLKAFQNDQLIKKLSNSFLSQKKQILKFRTCFENQEIEINNLKKKLNDIVNKYYKLQNTKIEYLDNSFKEILSLKQNEDWNIKVTYLQPVFHYWYNKENIIEVIINSKLEKKNVKNKIYLDNMILVVTDKEEILVLSTNLSGSNHFNGLDFNIHTLNSYQIKNKGNKTYIEVKDKNNRNIYSLDVIEYIPLTRFTLAVTVDYTYSNNCLYSLYKLI